MTALWALLVVMMVSIVVSRQGKTEDLETPGPAASSQPSNGLFSAPAFSLTDQDGAAFGTEQLKGRVWIAQFIFTHCTGPCPMLMSKMKQLQSAMPDERVQLLSLTVDPENDTPAVLKAKAKELGADPSRWHFLTGTRQQIETVARGLLTAVNTDAGKEPIFHNEKFLLFDTQGKCLGRFDSTDDVDMQKMRRAAVGLLETGTTR